MRNKLGMILVLLLSGPLAAAELASAPVRSSQAGAPYVAEASVEAVRQSVLSPQVAGRITQLLVKAGEQVRSGQVLLRIDAQAAAQQANASGAQVEAARAQLEVARSAFERQRLLFAQRYISQAALEQAEAQFKATEAAVRSTLAQAGAATTQTGFFTISAPYAGVVAALQVEQGDMAMPGKPLLTIYDPAAMRVVASLPQSKLGQMAPGAPVRIEIAGMPDGQRELIAQRVTVLPTVDPISNSLQLRLDLPAGSARVVPGMFARAYFPLLAGDEERLSVPLRAVLQRAELKAVYVLAADGKPLLRQVRLGKQRGDEVEVLAGLRAGERVALDPVAAARVR